MKRIPYSRQNIDKFDIDAVLEVSKSDWLTQGPMVGKFEDALCEYTGAKYAVAVSSGTAALHIACLCAGIGKGNEVITTPLTFVASANSILYCGGRPVFVDIEEDTVNIDPNGINERISANTKAIMPVHYAGHPAEMSRIHDIAEKNGLIVIEDAAHALGAEYGGSKIGSCRHSDMTVFSFHPVKHITTGEGGAVLTNNKKFYDMLKMLRQHGITKDSDNFKHENDGGWYQEMQQLGYNYRLTDIQCALGLSQLKKLDRFIRRRREIAGIYSRVFQGNEWFDLPTEKEWAESGWHLYPIRLKDRYVRTKAKIFKNLIERGLQVQVHYIPVYLHPYYQQLGYSEGLCRKAETFYQREMSIPLYPAMSDDDIDYTINNIEECFRNEFDGAI